jgi:hypothetical protein
LRGTDEARLAPHLERIKDMADRLSALANKVKAGKGTRAK